MFTFDPFRNFEMVRRELDRAFEDLATASTGRRPTLTGMMGSAYPLLNIGQDNERVVVEALVPGIDPEKIEVKVLGDELAISGTLEPRAGAEDGREAHRRERLEGGFLRSVKLPAEVDPDRVTAEYRDGVLRITADKTEQARPRRIQVAVA